MERRRFGLECVGVVLGTGMLALATYVFFTPNQIAPGGVSGLAILLHQLIGLPVGWGNLLINLPLLLMGLVSIGRRFLIKSVLSVAAFTVFYDAVFAGLGLPCYREDPLLAALFGGALSGAGIGLSLMAEGSTGGIDISSRLLQRRFPHLSMGKLLLWTDVGIIGASMAVFGSVSAALYATVAMFVATRVIDAMLDGLDAGRLAVVVTERGDALAQALLQELGRGVTRLEGTGAYRGGKKAVLLCAVRKQESYHLKRIVRRIDPAAFLVTAAAAEVAGEGFRAIDRDG